MAALRKEVVWVRFLEIAASDFTARYLRGNRQDRNAAAVTVIQTVDQMQVTWAATPRAHREFSREVCFRAGSKGGRLFMSYVNPLNLLLPANCIGYSVERIAWNAINSRYSGLSEDINHQVR
jgi:hypothetical protein